MISDTGIDLASGAVRVSGAFLWCPSSAVSAHAARVDIDEKDPFDQEWARRLDPMSVRAAWCVGEARRLAGLCGPSQLPNHEGVCVSTGMGAQQTRLRYASRLVTHGLAGTNPIDFPDSIDGAPAAHVALKWNLQGPSFTFLGAAHNALVTAARQLVLGNADRMHVVLGDVFDSRVRTAFADSRAGQPSPRTDEDRVFALVLERGPANPITQAPALLIGFTSVSNEALGGEPLAGELPNPDLTTTETSQVAAIAHAWLGLTGLVGAEAIACQDPATLEVLHCYPLTNLQWPQLAFARAEKR